MLTSLVAPLLALGLGFVATAGPPGPVGPSVLPISVSMTTLNEGHPVSLLDPKHPAWAHLAPTGAVAKVTVKVELHGNAIHRWVAHLDTPDSFLGITPDDCRGDEEAPPREVSCTFAVQAVSGVNRLLLHFTADDGRVSIDSAGTISGGQFDWDAGWEVLDATGQWSAIAPAQPIELPATMSSALRYVVTNTGDIPFRATNGCNQQVIPSHGRLVCLVRGVRPVQSLARRYEERLRLVDLVGATGEPDIQSTIRSFAGVFSLATARVSVGQVVVVSASGLPPGSSFALQFRIDDEPVLVGTESTTTGSSRLSFPLPSTSPGTARLEIIHDGLTIASLPFDVTRVPHKVDAAAPVWLWVAIPFVVLVGLLALILVRRRRRRSQLTESREPPDPGSYPSAIPARQEPAAARRS